MDRIEHPISEEFIHLSLPYRIPFLMLLTLLKKHDDLSTITFSSAPFAQLVALLGHPLPVDQRIVHDRSLTSYIFYDTCNNYDTTSELHFQPDSQAQGRQDVS